MSGCGSTFVRCIMFVLCVTCPSLSFMCARCVSMSLTPPAFFLSFPLSFLIHSLMLRISRFHNLFTMPG